MKIFLIDDELFAIKLMTRQLGNLGYQEVTAHERAQDALASISDSAIETPDLIICDLQMPEMDGVEFLRHLETLAFTGNLILVSGEDERILNTAQKLAQAHKLNVIGALHKPVSTAELRELMTRAQTAAPSRAARKTYAPDELRAAIVNRELINHYQPQVNLATGEVIGVESLVRWQHPEDGLVFPDQFIGAIEEHGLIDDMTALVLQQALRQTRAWQEQDLGLHVSVNISMDNLFALEFPDRVGAALAETGIPAQRLVLEVTESRLMRDPRSALDILTRLRLRQIGLSIDDFGTGHSSLKQLSDIPFDELKLDYGFVHDACIKPQLRAIVEASIAMARQLGMTTVAEGVENETDWHYLRRSACDVAQGYFIARPMPADTLGTWIEDWQTRVPALVRETS